MDLDLFTIVACAVIAVAFLSAWIYTSSIKGDVLLKHKKWIEQLPSVISTLGVLGTFIGITKGLMTFDTTDLDRSIPLLLDGLKTAFFTSLLGMSGSLVLNRTVSRRLENEDNQSEMQKAANTIVNALNSNMKELPSILHKSNIELVSSLSKDETIKIISADVEQMKDDLEELKGHVEELRGQNNEVIDLLNKINSASNITSEELPRLRAVAVTATSSISAIDNYIDEINGNLSSIENAAMEINENLNTIKSKDEEN